MNYNIKEFQDYLLEKMDINIKNIKIVANYIVALCVLNEFEKECNKNGKSKI